MGSKPIAFVDIETTGLNRVFYDLIEIAIHRTDELPWSTKVKPSLCAPPQARAVKVNGYNAEEWKDAPTWGNVAPEVHARLLGCDIATHNLYRFDGPWIEHALACWDPDYKPLRGVWIDTMVLARVILRPRGLQRLSLASCCEFLGIPGEGMHRADGGATRCRLIYEAMEAMVSP